MNLLFKKSREKLIAVIQQSDKCVYDYKIHWNDVIEEGLIYASGVNVAKKQVEINFSLRLEDKINNLKNLITPFKDEKENEDWLCIYRELKE